MDPARWRRVRALLQEAVALAPEARPAFLERACPDPEDRREVESLLAHHVPSASFLEEGVDQVAAALIDPDPLAPGQVLGSYRIVRELGRGGMGVVYLAHDLTLNRDVAIKMLPVDVSHDPRRRARFQQEARAAAAVPHAGIAQVYALEEDDRGQAYLVSEFVAGHTLRSEIERGPVPPHQALATAIQIADAVGAAHVRGIVHRDLKPENVMRTPEGAVKVLDFGLARLLSDGVDETRARLTLTGAAIGTPGYMSPEQIRGADTDVTTDIFSLGLMLHEMLTGRHAFGGRTNSASAIVHMLKGPPDGLPAAVVAGLPGINGVVTRCLEKEPALRYPSMAALADDLRAIARRKRMATSADLSRPGSWPPHAVESAAWWWRFHQVVVCAIYVSMIYPAWKLRGAPVAAGVHNLLVLAIIVAAALTTTLRLHAIFISRVSPGRLAAALRDARPWLRRSDWLMTLALLTGAGMSLARDEIWWAALFTTVAASATVAFLFIEPATAAAAFGLEDA